MSSSLVLYHYWRSSCSWRVRWVLNYKNIPAEKIHIHLLKQEHKSPDYLAVNPNGLVPTLVYDGKALTESLAIIEWLEEVFPSPPILPKDPWLRAQAREIALIIATGIQPLQNLRVQQKHSSSPLERETWARSHIEEGLAIVEGKLTAFHGSFCIGQDLSIADICLVPQVYNALRNQIDMQKFPRCKAIYEYCLTLAACDQASPAKQAEATP